MKLRHPTTMRYCKTSHGFAYLSWSLKGENQHNESGPSEIGKDGLIFWMLGGHRVLRTESETLFNLYRPKKGK